MKHLILLTLVFLTPLAAFAGVEEDWQRILMLDKGPAKKPSSREEALLIIRTHLQSQQKALESFVARYPNDPRAFDAKVRLATIQGDQAQRNGNVGEVDQAMRTLMSLENDTSVPAEKRATAGFFRVSLYMQSLQDNSSRLRESIISSAQNYVARYPGDRRGPRLLVEVATLCDDSPTLKRSLLEQALKLTREPALQARIKDDFRRLDYLGHPLELRMKRWPGGEIDLARLRGQVVVLIFWAADSPHSLLWLRDFRTAWERMPKGALTVVSISLDQSREEFQRVQAELPQSWLTNFTGEGWKGEVPRSLGINALPSVWILDKKGVVTTINAKSNYETRIRQLLRE